MCKILANPKESHLTVVKHMLRYLKGPKTSVYGIALVGYSDVDYICWSKSKSKKHIWIL